MRKLNGRKANINSRSRDLRGSGWRPTSLPTGNIDIKRQAGTSGSGDRMAPGLVLLLHWEGPRAAGRRNNAFNPSYRFRAARPHSSRAQ